MRLPRLRYVPPRSSARHDQDDLSTAVPALQDPVRVGDTLQRERPGDDRPDDAAQLTGERTGTVTVVRQEDAVEGRGGVSNIAPFTS